MEKRDGVLCDRRMPIKLKGMFYRTEVRVVFSMDPKVHYVYIVDSLEVENVADKIEG